MAVNQVVFVLEHPGLEQDDFSETKYDVDVYLDRDALCESIHGPIQNIMESTLCTQGHVTAVYVNVPALVCFQMRPDTEFYRSESIFCQNIDALITNADGVMTKATGEVMAMRLLNREAMVNQFPPNAIKIGCSSGPQNCPLLNDHLETISEPSSLVVVVGKITSPAITYLDTTVKASNFVLTTSACLMRIIDNLERKFHLH